MIWVLLVVAVGIAGGLGYLWWNHEVPPVPSGDQLDLDTLRRTLDDAGIERSSTRIPNVEILQPHISERDDFLGAVQARRGNKRAILVALGDRLVAGEATMGKMGAEIITIRWEEIEGFDQSFDIGGEFEIEAAGDTYTYSHIPRSQTRDFAELTENRVDAEDDDG